MKETKWYEVILLLVYVMMVAVCVCLNVFNEQGINIPNIIVNASMFLIVAIIFLSCEFRCFRPAAFMVGELKEATEKIRRDALHTNRFLWEKYKESKEEIFPEGRLKEELDDYRFELDRIEQSAAPYYKCNIEDYISYDLMDSVMHRNTLNQVPGAMTGLGILGTFIGLVIGLGGFNTGSTAEIAGSITPLMEGIKVAFHTSIYGMVFSLVFNYSLKRRIEDGEEAVREFLTAFKKYVMPNTENDGFNRLIELAQEQTRVISDLPAQGAHNLALEIEQVLTPQFDRFDRTISDFAIMQSKNQMDALSVIVNSFIAEMNKSLGDMFSNLSDSIFKINATQRENEKKLTEMLVSAGGASDKLEKVQAESANLTRLLGNYITLLANLQENMQESLANIKDMAGTDRELLSGVRRSAAELKGSETFIKTSMEMMDKRIKAQEELLKQINETIAYSYDNIENGFERASRGVDELAESVNKLNQMRENEGSRKKRGLFK